VLRRLVVLGAGDFSLDVGYLLGEGHVLRQKWDVMKPMVTNFLIKMGSRIDKCRGS
jgi:hypothetical protein